MRTLGLLFIVVGTLLCLTLFFIFPGLAMIAVGALLVIASRGRQSASGELGSSQPGVPTLPAPTTQPARVPKGFNIAVDVVCGMLLMVGLILAVQWFVQSRSAPDLQPTVTAPVSQPVHPARKHAKPKVSPAQ